MANGKIKLKIFEAYGGPVCAKCGFSDIRALCLDHTNNDGWKEKSDNTRYRYTGGNKYRTLLSVFKKTGLWPLGYQVLCANCNLIKEIEEGTKARGL